MRSNLLLSGGFDGDHDFSTSASLAAVLSGAGFETDVEHDVDAGLARLACGRYDLVTCNALRWQMLGDAYAPWRERFGFSPSPEARAALVGHLARGGGLLAVHTAVICFDDWSEWASILGASWSWGRSSHPPVGPVSVVVDNTEHPVVAGVGGFDVVDEVYSFLDVADDVEPLMTACPGLLAQPLVWARSHGGGRVVVDTLGHDRRSYASEAHATVVRQAAKWLVGKGA